MTYDPIQYINDVEIIRNPLENPPPGEVIVDAETRLPAATACSHCGAPMDAEDKFCNACGQPRQTAAPTQPDENRKFVVCKSCGSQIEIDADTRSYVCAFCGSTYVVDFAPDRTGRQAPEFIIGFAVPREQAIDKFQQWIKANRWYHPGDLRQAGLTDRIQGVYLPFWSFSVLAESDWDASIGEYWYRTETYVTRDSNGKTVTRTRRVRETEWWDLAGDHHRYYSGYLVSASKSLEHAMAQKVMPFDLPALKRYEAYFLAGWASEEYTVPQEDAYEISKQYFCQLEQSNIGQFLPGDTWRRLNVSTRFRQGSADLILLPYYLLTYRYREKRYRFMVNGQTGKVWGDKPLSKSRIWAAVGLGALLLAALVLALILAGGIL